MSTCVFLSSYISSGSDEQGTVVVLHEFKGTRPDELALELGAVVTILEEDEHGWCRGTYKGRTGWFPSNFVGHLEDCAERFGVDIAVSNSIIFLLSISLYTTYAYLVAMICHHDYRMDHVRQSIAYVGPYSRQ